MGISGVRKSQGCQQQDSDGEQEQPQQQAEYPVRISHEQYDRSGETDEENEQEADHDGDHHLGVVAGTRPPHYRNEQVQGTDHEIKRLHERQAHERDVEQQPFHIWNQSISRGMMGGSFSHLSTS